ncbi:MAG: ArsB/NhaD family transporter, partial [Desulfurococcaceae archaeon]
VLFMERDLINTINRRLSEKTGKIEAFIHHYYIGLSENTIAHLRYGLLMLLGFIAMVALNDNIALLLEKAFSQRVEPHSLLAFVPYIFIALSIAAIRIEDVPKYLEKSVEWPSLMFFICLFILSYSLTYSGVMAKLAYLLSRSASLILPIMILSSTLLSSILDNLSVVIAFTPIATFMNRIGLTSDLIYFSLLYGGVLGGNYTPIGSTANIVALSMAEKKRIKITWSIWLKKSLVIASAQVIVAIAWLYTCLALGI